MIVNMGDLAVILGVSRATVQSWVKRGCPAVQKGRNGRPWQFNTAEVIEWRSQQIANAAIGETRSLDMDEAKRRKVAAEAAMAELELAQKKGELVEIESVGELIEEEYARVRARLLGLPVKVAPALEHADLAEREHIIRNAVIECLDELTADAAFPSGGEVEAGAGDAETATVADGQSVG